MNNSLNNTYYKVCLIGTEKTGKTLFVDCLKEMCNNNVDWITESQSSINDNFTTNNDTHKYNASKGVHVTSIIFSTTYGDIKVNFWDTAGNPLNAGLGDGYYIGSNACILFSDTYNKKLSNEIKQEFKHSFIDAQFNDYTIQYTNINKITTNKSFIKLCNKLIQNLINYKDCEVKRCYINK